MKVIVAGSRSIDDDHVLESAIAESGFEITEVVSGAARGIDSSAIIWAEKKNLKVEIFEPNWNDLSHPDCLIKTSPWGQKYDARAGLRRNELMAVYGEALIAIWDGKSKGTKHMIKMARKRELPIYIYRVDVPRLSGHHKYETRDAFYRRLASQAREADTTSG